MYCCFYCFFREDKPRLGLQIFFKQDKSPCNSLQSQDIISSNKIGDKSMAKKKTATPKAKKAAPKKTVKKATATKAPAKKVKAKAPAKKAAPKIKTKRKPNPAFIAPLTPSAALAEVVGSKALPRTEAVKKVWAYIKKNDLQNPKNKREIIADAKLKGVLKKNKVTMFELAKIISENLSK
jgi:chromatin remodeling complex protein RSC6